MTRVFAELMLLRFIKRAGGKLYHRHTVNSMHNEVSAPVNSALIVGSLSPVSTRKSCRKPKTTLMSGYFCSLVSGVNFLNAGLPKDRKILGNSVTIAVEKSGDGKTLCY